jgi:hypothetical protein
VNAELAWSCPEPGAVRVEAYSPKDGLFHGSLDAAIHVCAGHVGRAREWVSDCGRGSFVCPDDGRERPAIACGTAHVYT